MNWESLLPVIVGGLIATIPIMISNLVQIYLHNSEIKQKEKEARISASEKWIERDINLIMESIDKWFYITTKIRFLISHYEKDEEAEEKEESILEEIDGLWNELFTEQVFAAKRLNSFILVPSVGMNIDMRNLMTKYYKQYSFAQNEYADFLLSHYRMKKYYYKMKEQYPDGKKPELDRKQEEEKLNKVILRAGKVHEALRDALILIRYPE